MKRATLAHPKLAKLCEVSGMSRREAIGLLTLLWDFTGQYATNGAIGRYTNQVIAQACDWPIDRADELAIHLIRTKWMDEHPDPSIRLVIHDWQDHCEQWVKKRLAAEGGVFIDSKQISKPDIQNGYPFMPAPPSQAKPSQAKPSPAPRAVAAGGRQAAVAALRSLGVSERKAKAVAGTVGLTPIAVHRLWRLCQDADTPAGMLVAKCEGRDFAGLPDPIPPEELCELCKSGVIASVAGIAVNGSVRWNSGCLSLDGHQIPAADLRTDAIRVRQ